MIRRPLAADVFFILQLMVGLFAILELFAGDWPVLVVALAMCVFCHAEHSALHRKQVEQVRGDVTFDLDNDPIPEELRTFPRPKGPRDAA